MLFSISPLLVVSFFPLFVLFRAFLAFSVSVSLLIFAGLEALAEESAAEVLGLRLFVVSTIVDDPGSNPRIFSICAVADFTPSMLPDMINFVAILMALRLFASYYKHIKWVRSRYFLKSQHNYLP